MTTQLSNRTHALLQAFADLKGGHMSINDAQVWDQRAFRALLKRQMIAYRPQRGFHITPKGRDAWNSFVSTDVFRSPAAQRLPLTAYFDPTAYGLKIVKRKDAA